LEKPFEQLNQSTFTSFLNCNFVTSLNSGEEKPKALLT